MATNDDPYDLNRFLSAQETIYESVLEELGNGRKQSHWMWFIFPQIEGLGYSSTSRYYSIKSIEEAREYLHHPILGQRLLECTEKVLAINGKTALEIFGAPDDLKLRSSMTLFACVAGPESVFVRVLEKYFDGKPDQKTQIIVRTKKQDS